MAINMDQTKDLWQRSQGLINQAVGRGTGMLADRIEHYTTLAHDVCDVLREKGEPQAAEMVEMLAAGVDDAAGYLRAQDGASLWNDAQSFARGRTWLLAGLGFVGGVVAARAVRSANDMARWQQPDYVESYARSGYGAPSYDDTMGEAKFGESSFNGSSYSERL